MSEEIMNCHGWVTSPDGTVFYTTVSNRGQVFVEKQIPGGEDIARRDYQNFQGILQKAWSTGVKDRAIEIAGGTPLQVDIDAAILEFEDYIDTRDSEILRFKIGNQQRLIDKWGDPTDNPFSTAIRDKIKLILEEDPNS